MHIPLDPWTLPNGLRVIFSEDHSAPIVATNLWYHVGSKNERAGKTGFAHLFEHMLFEGSAHVPEKAYIPTIQRLGGDVNGSTGPDTTNYYETVPSEYLPLALWLESDRMGWLLPAMTQAKLDNQRSVVKNERRWRYDNQPYGTWFEKFLGLAFPGGHPYQHSVIGSMEDLDTASLDDVASFFRTHYTPRNAVLSVVGDFEPSEARRLVEDYFGPIPGGGDPPRVPAWNIEPRGEQRLLVDEDVQFPRVFIGYHVPAMGAEGHYAASLITDVLAAGKSSRLYRKLVYEDQIAQHAVSYHYALELSSIVFVEAMARPGVTAEQLEAALLTEVERLQDGPPSDLEMESIHNQIATHYYATLQTVNGRADQISEYTIHHDDPSRIRSELGRFLGVTAGEIQASARRYLVPENRNVITYQPTGGGVA